MRVPAPKRLCSSPALDRVMPDHMAGNALVEDAADPAQPAMRVSVAYGANPVFPRWLQAHKVG